MARHAEVLKIECRVAYDTVGSLSAVIVWITRWPSDWAVTGIRLQLNVILVNPSFPHVTSFPQLFSFMKAFFLKKIQHLLTLLKP